MFSKPLPSSFSVSIFVLFVLSCTPVSSQKVITLISGRHVPVHLIQQHFKKKLTASDFNKNIIYELTDQNVIQGPDLHIDLQSDVHHGHVTHTSQPTVTFNGNMSATPMMGLKTLKAKSYDIIVNDESGEILAVTGNGILLMPLDEAEFSGVFVNKMTFTKQEINLSTDSKILLSRGRNLRNSSSNILVHTQDRAFQGSMSVPEPETRFSTRQAQNSCRSGTTHYVEIAVAYDNTFCGLFNNVESIATEVVQNIVDASNEAFAQNTCIQLALVHVEAHCNDVNDPYGRFTSLSYDEILEEFRVFWIESRGDVQRDTAYLMTGFPEASSIAGLAFLGVACDTVFGYGWIEGPSTVVFGHEVGHTLGADHTGRGIMQGILRATTPLRFSGVSAREFRNYIDNSGTTSCISTTRPLGLPEGPSTTDNTCASGFSRDRALSCRNRRLRTFAVSLAGSGRERLRITLQQRNGQFRVRYQVTGGLFIVRYRDSVTTLESNPGAFETFRGNARVVTSSRDAGALTRPSGEISCCGQDLFVVTDVRVCLNSGGTRFCRTFGGSFRQVVVCENICFPNTTGLFRPMSADQACPSCS